MNRRLVAYFSAQGSTAKLAKTLAAAAEAETWNAVKEWNVVVDDRCQIT